MRGITTLMTAALIAVAIPAAAQDATQPAAQQAAQNPHPKRIDISIGFGFTVPYSSAPTFGSATVFPFAVAYNFNDKVAVQAGYGFHRFPSKTLEANVTQLPSGPSYISSALVTANRQMHDFDGAVVYTMPEKGLLRPYGLAGIGLYQQVINVTSSATGDVEVCAPVLWICYPTAQPATEVLGERRYNNFGFNVGGGATLRFGELARLFVEVRYIHTYGPTVKTPSGGTIKANGNYFPIVFGFRL